jgi:predicted Zn-dependent protease with MMP-like domain
MSDVKPVKVRRRRPLLRARPASGQRVEEWFVALVEQALDQLPEPFAAKVQNLVVVVEARPDRATLDQMGLDGGGLLLGLYQGVPLPERSVEAPPLMPDQITIFQDPILALSRDPEQIKSQVRQTVIHELGHYFGLSDREMAELEGS